MSIYNKPSEILPTFSSDIFPKKEMGDLENVKTTGNQLIDGNKTFDDIILGSISGNAQTLTGLNSLGSGSIITANERTKLGEITDTASGIVISTTERGKLTAITDTGSGAIISTAERGKLITDAERTKLTAISNTGSGAIITANERTKLGEITNTGSGVVISTAERGKLNGIDESADITNTQTVLDAGALMATGATNQTIGGEKTFSSGIFSTIGSYKTTGTNKNNLKIGSAGVGNSQNVNNGVDGENIAIGNNAGRTQTGGALAIGANAGTNQASGAIAIGVNSAVGGNAQALNAIAIGKGSGAISQGAHSICIGYNTGNGSIGGSCVAIGSGAGQGAATGGSTTPLAANSIAIGNVAAYHGSSANVKCVVLNASGGPTQRITAEGFYVKPVRGVAHGKGAGVMVYEASTGEISYSTN